MCTKQAHMMESASLHVIALFHHSAMTYNTWQAVLMNAYIDPSIPEPIAVQTLRQKCIYWPVQSISSFLNPVFIS